MYCLAPVLGFAFIPLVAAFFQTNYFLGKSQNDVTNVGNDGLPLPEKDLILRRLLPGIKTRLSCAYGLGSKL